MASLLRHGKSWKGKKKEMPLCYFRVLGKKVKCAGKDALDDKKYGCGCVFVLDVKDARKILRIFTLDRDGLQYTFTSYVNCPECKERIYLGKCSVSSNHDEIKTVLI